MLETVRQIIKKFQLVAPGDVIVVGVSGGADSLALLHLLRELEPRIAFNLHAATLNHQLRGEESDGDVAFVERICSDWDIPLVVGTTDVKGLAASRKLGIEAAARVARYDFLAETASSVGAMTIAVAHHADDQAETVLMHLLRGAGMKGAAGMRLKSPVPEHANLSLIRPLLRVTRAEIEAYCEACGVTPRHDSTNDDTTIFRNYIRRDALPYLEHRSPHVRVALARFAELAAVEDDYFNQQVQQLVELNTVESIESRVSISRRAFQRMHMALQRRLLMWAVGQLETSESAPSQLILEAVEIGIRGQQGSVGLLGSGLRLRVDYDLIYVEHIDAPVPKADLPLLNMGYEQKVEIPSVIDLGDYRLAVGLDKVTNEALSCQLAIDDVSTVILRTRQNGDRFTPFGMDGHTQKLSRWMVNAKIPQVIRDQIPLIVINGDIAGIFVNRRWIISDSFAVRNTSSRVIYFQFLQNS